MHDDTLIAFLIEAKLQTYAAEGAQTQVEPALPGSRQLEYVRGEWLYRDIYFGGARFAGQETVYCESTPVWAMTYFGGVDESLVEQSEIGQVYRFLRQALRLVPHDAPYRGPRRLEADRMVYTAEVHGNIEDFWGVETILAAERCADPVYTLRFSGGRLRV